MPIHDWTLVPAGIFHHFHHCWITAISDALNAGRMPPEYYALAEQIAGGLGPDVLTLETMGLHPDKGKHIAVRHCRNDRVVAILEIVSPGIKDNWHALQSFVKKQVKFLRDGIHLLVIDLFSPTPFDPQGMHQAIWNEIDEGSFQLPLDKPLALVSYSSGWVKEVYLEPVAVGSSLLDMPLFLESEVYVPVPLDATYQTAFAAVPKRWRDVLAPSGANKLRSSD